MGIVDQARDIAKLAQDIHAMPLYEKVVAMQANLVQMVDDNATLRNENRELKDALSLRQELQFERNLYWRGAGDQRTGPFCPACFNKDGKAVQMLRFQKYMGRPVACPACGFMVGEDGDAVAPRIAELVAGGLSGGKRRR